MITHAIAVCVVAWSFGWLSGAFNWPTSTPRPTVTARPTEPHTPLVPRTPTPTSTAEVGVPDTWQTPHPELFGTRVVRAVPAGTRIVLTDLMATAGGWAVIWTEVAGDLWDPQTPTEVWYAHTGTPEVSALRIATVHRIDRLPVYLGTASPAGDEIAIVLNELTNWKTATSTSGRITHQWFGRLELDGQWIRPPDPKLPIATNLGVHGGIGHMVWSADPTRPLGIVRVTTEATCSDSRHQCTYSQRVDPSTGAVVGRGSITMSYQGHQTAPQIIPFSAQTSWLTTISDVLGTTGGIWARTNFLGGVGRAIVPGGFRLDLDPRSAWNGVEGVGKRVGTLWRQVRTQDNKGNATGEPWAMRLTTWDYVQRAGSTVRTPLTLSDVQLTEWSTAPGLSYGYPIHSRWNTALSHIPGGGWAVGFQDGGQYVIGAVDEVGVWRWKEAVAPILDYAGDVAVRRDRIGYVATRPGPDGTIELILGER